MELAGESGVEDLVIHAFTDGRDTSPTSGAGCLARVESWGIGRVGSVVGRYFAMDRDKRWDRTEKAIKLLVDGEGDHHADTGEAAVRAAYERDETDEFITPTTVGDEARIRPGDSVIAFNFRPDRMRQITEKLTETVDRYVTMAEYDEDWTYPILFPPKRPADHDRQGDLRPRAEAAARGGDGEVRARDVLLQRRRGEPVRGRGARAGAVAARRPDLRPQAGDERARGGGRVRRALELGSSRRSRSSTSRTRTWSGTPATSRPR